jgi:hypothetical protein
MLSILSIFLDEVKNMSAYFVNQDPKHLKYAKIGKMSATFRKTFKVNILKDKEE